MDGDQTVTKCTADALFLRGSWATYLLIYITTFSPLVVVFGDILNDWVKNSLKRKDDVKYPMCAKLYVLHFVLSIQYLLKNMTVTVAYTRSCNICFSFALLRSLLIIWTKLFLYILLLFYLIEFIIKALINKDIVYNFCMYSRCN